jgi:thiol-disulfide isomerase/thioredoxin
MSWKILFLGILLLFAGFAAAENQDNESVVVHFFYSQTCPHCAAEKPFLQKLEAEYPWLKVEYLDVGEVSNAQLYLDMARECGGTAQGVPATFICGQMIIGYGSDVVHGKRIRNEILDCRKKSLNPTGTEEQCEDVDRYETMVDIPLFGEVDAASMSLPLFTIVLGGLDGFNPCAFFVLFFLLSLLIHAKSRARMLLIGGVFVFFSGFIYFIFMAAWLNLFLFIGQFQIITTLAGFIALFIGAVNVKDFFWFKKGISLSISDSAKPKLFTRMRNLMKATELSSMLFGTAVLAIAANTYELLCTAGFPMVYTRVLTLSNLSNLEYYMYLAFYNIVYVVPLMTIVAFFTYTMGSRKLKEEEGRSLKLMSGNMMLALGLILVFAPEMLNNIITAVLVLGASASIAVVFSIYARKNEGGDAK